MDAVAGKGPRPLGTYVIFLKNTDGLDQQLRSLAEREGLKRVSLGIGAPPDDYQVSPEADITVVVYNVGRRNDQKVTANFALRKANLTNGKADAIVAAIAAVLPK